MDKIPFDPYDFFGYIAAGLLAVVGMDITLGFPHVIHRDLKAVDGAVLLLGVYVAGQIIANFAKAILEDGVVDKLLGRPSVNLFRKAPRVRGFLFSDFYKPLPPEIAASILAKAKAGGIHVLG